MQERPQNKTRALEMDSILIVEDNRDMQFALSSILKSEGYETIIAGDGNRALKEVKHHHPPNLVLLDIKLPGMDGMKILEEIRKIDNNLIVIMLTAYGDVKGAVRAMRLGAFDYVTKPFDNEELILIIKKALQTQSLNREVENLRKRLGERSASEEIIGESPQIKEVLRQVAIVAPTNLTVIVQGESGTGKELIVRAIHQKSLRKEMPFIPLDCGAIPETLVESELFGHEKGAFTGADTQKEGRFELANGGTLFLDEITNLSEAIQVKLLRVLQERRIQRIGGKKEIKIDVRIIAATNVDFSGMVRAGKFRADLFHRLNEFHINLPPLRDRRGDIPILSRHFLQEANREFDKKIEGFSDKTMEILLDYPCPGNVRELKNLVKKAVLLADSNYLTTAHLLPEGTDTSGKPDLHYTLEEGGSLREITQKAAKEIERDMLKQALIKSGGNKSKAARILKIDRMTLYSKLKEYPIEW